jgi:DNA invertase Pin-like site-specific DNA recombinase
MRVKYNRISSLSQTGNRFTADTEKYDLTLMDKISGSVSFFERPKASELKVIIENYHKNASTEPFTLVVEEFSRLGRNTSDLILTLEWMEKMEVNVVVRNLGLQSRPNGKKNPIWKMISSVMSSIYEMEAENIRERTKVGRLVYVKNGGKLGRPINSIEDQRTFLNKPKNKKIAEYLNKGWTMREIAKQVDASTKTILKVKKIVNS